MVWDNNSSRRLFARERIEKLRRCGVSDLWLRDVLGVTSLQFGRIKSEVEIVSNSDSKSTQRYLTDRTLKVLDGVLDLLRRRGVLVDDYRCRVEQDLKKLDSGDQHLLIFQVPPLESRFAEIRREMIDAAARGVRVEYVYPREAVVDQADLAFRLGRQIEMRGHVEAPDDCALDFLMLRQKLHSEVEQIQVSMRMEAGRMDRESGTRSGEYTKAYESILFTPVHWQPWLPYDKVVWKRLAVGDGHRDKILAETYQGDAVRDWRAIYESDGRWVSNKASCTADFLMAWLALSGADSGRGGKVMRKAGKLTEPTADLGDQEVGAEFESEGGESC